MSKINVGILGFGLSGRVFHANLIKNMHEYFVRSIATSRKEEVRELFPEAKVATVNDIIHDKNIDLVIVTTPNALHAEQVTEALKAGKHVVVEKPFVTSYDDGKYVTQLADQKHKEENIISAVYHNRRWDSDFLTIKEIIRKKQLGKIKHFESHFDRFRPNVSEKWREKKIPGSGILFDLGSHLIDQSLCLFGDPEWIWADIDSQRDGAVVDDYFHIILGYGEMRVELHSSSYVNGAIPRFAIHGERGSYIKYGLDYQEDALKNGKLAGGKYWGRDDEDLFGTLYIENSIKTIETLAGNYQSFYKQLYKAINGEGETPVSFDEGLKVIFLIEAAKKSSEQGCKITLF